MTYVFLCGDVSFIVEGIIDQMKGNWFPSVVI